MFKNKFIIALTCLLLGASVQATAESAVAPPKKLTIDLLYVQVAPTATLAKVCDAAKHCQEKLILQQVPLYLLTFNNGTPRVGGNILTERFVHQYYNKVGKAGKLNTALMSFEDGKVQEHLITIANPVYSSKTQEMTYDITFIKKLDPITEKTKLTNVALFIDGVCAICVT